MNYCRLKNHRVRFRLRWVSSKRLWEAPARIGIWLKRCRWPSVAARQHIARPPYCRWFHVVRAPAPVRWTMTIWTWSLAAKTKTTPSTSRPTTCASESGYVFGPARPRAAITQKPKVSGVPNATIDRLLSNRVDPQMVRRKQNPHLRYGQVSRATRSC